MYLSEIYCFTILLVLVSKFLNSLSRKCIFNCVSSGFNLNVDKSVYRKLINLLQFYNYLHNIIF